MKNPITPSDILSPSRSIFGSDPNEYIFTLQLNFSQFTRVLAFMSKYDAMGNSTTDIGGFDQLK